MLLRFSGGHFGCHLKYDNFTACKNISFNNHITSFQDLIKMQTSIQTNIRFQISVFNSVVGNLYLVDILDAILNFRQGSRMPRIHYFDSIMSVMKSRRSSNMYIV